LIIFGKFSVLKKLLVAFELEDELLIKYAASDEAPAEPNRFLVRKKYWQQLLPLIKNTHLFQQVNPSKDHWLSAGAGIAGMAYTFTVTKTQVRIELGILTASKDRNKDYFKKLLRNKDHIEQTAGITMDWEELPENKMSRIKYELPNANLFNENHWPRMNEFFIENLPKFEKAFAPHIRNLK